MIFIHGIDNNILNSGARFLRVYQEESKMRALPRDKYFGGLKPNQNNLENGGARFSVNIGICLID